MNYIWNIIMCLICSIIIGVEREFANKEAGLRTIMLVCLGACLSVIFTLEYIERFPSFNVDAIRMIAYFLVAIGFVGGGIIHKNDNKIEGITTSALLLPMTLIGFLCGIGNLGLAFLVTLIIFSILKIKIVTGEKYEK